MLDPIDIEAHERYALYLSKYDPVYTRESPLVASHSRIIGTTAPFLEKLPSLFELHTSHISYAHFTPPPHYASMACRFFTHKTLPDLAWPEEVLFSQDQDGDKLDRLQKTIQLLDTLLAQANSLKARFQQG